MTDLNLVEEELTPGYAEVWDKFIDSSNNGTLFHKLGFLAYHRERFSKTAKYLTWYKGKKPFCVMPANITYEDDSKVLSSPYGASFGGIIFSELVRLKDAHNMVELFIEYLKNAKINYCHIVNAPNVYMKQNCETINYCLEQQGFRVSQKDLFHLIDLRNTSHEQIRTKYSSAARYTLRKHKDTFEIQHNADVAEFFEILLEDKKRHKVSPTHTLEELENLKRRYPNKLWVDIAHHVETGAKAGICYFALSQTVLMTFYMARQNAALRLNGVNVLIDYGVPDAINKGFHFFDCGGASVG